MADAETLFAAHRTGCSGISRVVGATEARELTQEVFLRVARGPLPQTDGAGGRAWVFTIARNLALNHVRDDRRRGTSVTLQDTAVAPTQEPALSVREALDTLQPLDRDDPAMIVEAFLDGEPVAPCHLRAALAHAAARDHFVDLWPTILSYLRIATHPGVFRAPLSPDEAMGNIQQLLVRPHVRALGEGDGFWDVDCTVADIFPLRGDAVPDAHLAALLRQHSVSVIYTNDADFRRFSFRTVINPFEA